MTKLKKTFNKDFIQTVFMIIGALYLMFKGIGIKVLININKMKT